MLTTWRRERLDPVVVLTDGLAGSRRERQPDRLIKERHGDGDIADRRFVGGPDRGIEWYGSVPRAGTGDGGGDTPHGSGDESTSRGVPVRSGQLVKRVGLQGEDERERRTLRHFLAASN